MALSRNRRAALAWTAWLGAFAAAAGTAWTASAEPLSPMGTAPQAPQPLTLDAAVRAALAQNPSIIAARQEHGIAAAGVMVARAYPFNPVWEGRFRYAWPVSAGATNQEPVENTVTLEMEVRGQHAHRMAQAQAALSRADWEIASQEISLAVRVVRAFDAVVYRYQKNQHVLDTIKLDQDTFNQAQDLVKAQKLKPSDLIILRTEIDDARAQLGASRTALATASSELHSALGVIGGSFALHGDLCLPPLPEGEAEALAETARANRPDRHAREAAVAEADAALRLERANRFGNPVVGPTYEYDNSSIHNLGVQFALPLPVLNAHRSDILQREAEKERAVLELRQTDVEIGQDVEAALVRLKQAQAWVETYERDVLPDLQKSLKEMQDLFNQGSPDVTALAILDVQRKVLTARDGYLDARFEVRQAVADLAAALGDPCIAVGPCAAPPAPNP
ncbi:MAG TPA: TolC family protein [Gemmataceae bacterium]|nr:TolC family protein [Gemmataceae bacterium]